MNIHCEIIEDLLPLYEDEVCTQQTRRTVEEHLQKCQKCRKLMEASRGIPAMELQPEKTVADKAAAKSFRKIRVRWMVSLLALVLMMPVFFLGWGQIKGQGTHFTNLHEIDIGNAFMSELQKGNYEKAYSYIDINNKKEYFLETWFDEETLADIEEDGKRKFCESADWLIAAGGIREYKYLGINKNSPDSYELTYAVWIADEEHKLRVNVSDDGVLYFGCGGSFLVDPLARFAMWSEYLWQHYEGCYYDPETRQYIYYD